MRMLTLFGGIGVGLVLSAAILVSRGVTLSELVNEFVIYIFFDEKGIGQMLTAATPLILVSLSASAALKLRFWNVGIDGQFWLGAIGATWISVNHIGPDELRLPLMMFVAVLFGGAWLIVPTAFKLKYGVDEIISTLLMTYVAFLLVQHLLYGVWRDPVSGYPVSPMFDERWERLSRVGLCNLNTVLYIALAATVVLWLVLEVSRLGFYATAVGTSISGATAAGIPVAGVILVCAAISGGIAGLAGGVVVAGQEYRLTQFAAQNYMFSAIVISFISRFRIIPGLVTALIVGAFYTAGDALKVFYQLPTAIVTLIEAIILLSVLVAEFFSRFHIKLGVARSG